MTTYYVATLAHYVLVEAESEDEARRLGLDALVALFADLRLQRRQNVPIGIRTVRLATEEEINFWQWHRESVEAECSNAKFRIDIADDLMCVLDQNNNGYDCHVIADYDAAVRQLDAWAQEYQFDRNAAVSLVDEVLAER